jgi:hypothetical protein
VTKQQSFGSTAQNSSNSSSVEEMQEVNKKQREQMKMAIRKLTNVDNFLDELWHKVDNKKLSSSISELRDAINLLNTNNSPQANKR